MALLPCAPGPAEAHFLERLTDQFTGVRRAQTRVVVVTRPEYLSTVVAFGGDLLIVTDETGDAMLELGAVESPIVYLIGPKREVIVVFEDLGVGSPLSGTKLCPAARASLKIQTCGAVSFTYF